MALRRSWIIGALAGASLVSCAAPPNLNDPATNPAPPLAQLDDPEAVPLGDLPRQDLAPGECALFLWTRRQPPQFVFMGRTNGEALLALADGPAKLERTAFTGEPIRQQFSEQTFFEPKEQLEVKVSVTRGRELDDGVTAPSGVIRLKRASGWQTVVPVGGLVGCK
ncbi:MAG: hypothetical protein ACFB2Z_06930 [Maricaulaceae bacterium]